MTKKSLKVLANGFLFPESPRWRDGRLWVSDLLGNKVYRVAPDGTKEFVVDVPNRPSGIGFLRDGTPVVVSMTDRKIVKIVDGALQPYADLSGLAKGDVNDLSVDPEGRIYVGDFGYDFFGGAEAAPGDLFLVSEGGSVRRVADNLVFPNGSVLLSDRRTFVVAETWAKRLTAFDRAEDGTLSHRRLYADLGDRTPDGICIDAKDGIWVSSFATGEFIRVLEGGTVTDQIVAENQIAIACALGGEKGQTLFCLTYRGTTDDVFAGKFNGMISVVDVDVPAP